jgi:hypothetical protein
VSDVPEGPEDFMRMAAQSYGQMESQMGQDLYRGIVDQIRSHSELDAATLFVQRELYQARGLMYKRIGASCILLALTGMYLAVSWVLGWL